MSPERQYTERDLVEVLKQYKGAAEANGDIPDNNARALWEGSDVEMSREATGKKTREIIVGEDLADK